MILSLKSDNKQFSYLIGKNPNSPPKVMEDRKGCLIGWYSTPDSYSINFIDGPDEVSYKHYKGQEFDYLSYGKYCHPFLAHKMVNEFFKLYEEYDTISNNSCTTILKCKPSAVELFRKHFPEVEISTEQCEYWPNYCTITISCNSTMGYFIKFLRVFFFYVMIDNEESFVQSEAVDVKVDDLVDIDAPYFIRYLYKTNLIRNAPKKFEQYRERLNQSSQHEFDIKYCNNFQSRMDFVLLHARDSNVVDVGCGEGRYVKRLFGQNKSYQGVDIDEECRRKAEKKAKLFDVPIYASIDEADFTDSCVVCTEVLEHQKQPAEFLKELLRDGIKKIILTTPNRSFNKHYLIDCRHDDHHCEMNEAEFVNLLSSIFTEHTIDIYPIGDSVDGISTTLGAVIQ